VKLGKKRTKHNPFGVGVSQTPLPQVSPVVIYFTTSFP